MTLSKQKTCSNTIAFAFLCLLSAIFLVPILLVLLNSFKSRFYISSSPFAMPNSETFVGFENYLNGLSSSGFFISFIRSVWVSIASVLVIIVCTSMASWFIVRVKNKFTKAIYFLFAFSMIVPFQMVMYTMTFIVNRISFDNVFGIVFVYLGFGAGLSVFMFTGFVKAVPLEIEEAAEIDGCNPLQTFFLVVVPILKPTMISVGVLEAMWVWNDYLLPTLVLDIKKYKTIPMLIQYFRGSYGKVEMGPMMASIMLTVIPIIIVYLFGQKYIIKGVADGAVKG